MFGIIKGIGTLVISVGAGRVIKNAVIATTPVAVSKLEKVAIGVGGFVISSMVSDAAEKYVNKTIDETFNGKRDFVECLSDECEKIVDEEEEA